MTSQKISAARIVITVAALIVSQAASSNELHISLNHTREAYSQPFAGLNEIERAQFFRGRDLFRQSWVIAPAKDTLAGLGPLYNRISCASCHPKNGRGRAPDDSQQRMQSMLVRLSIAGQTPGGAPLPHPNYGTQLNEEGVPGVPGEGRARVHWEYHIVTFADGTRQRLRKPKLSFHELNYGSLTQQPPQQQSQQLSHQNGSLKASHPLHNTPEEYLVLTSARIGPPVFGLGLLEAISEQDLQEIAQEKKSDGVRGKANRVWDIANQQPLMGRFGAKANVASLRSQTAEALHGDLGITSPLLTNENCMLHQTECLQAPSGGSPELTTEQLDDLEFYFRHLAVPARRNTDNPEVIAGEKLFADIGCALCHRPQLQTAKDYPHAALANKSIQPYTDLLLHDMGEGLADDRPDFLASGREWRTAPLWGIGLTAFINEYQAYLHDGRAQTLAEAILWHGGEAETAMNRYLNLSKNERDFLEKFLLSL